MEREIFISDLGLDSKQQISAIEAEVHRNPWSELAVVAHLQNPISVSKGVFLEGNLVGYILGQHFDNEYHVLNVAVCRDQQKKGLGHLLLAGSIVALWKDGVRKVFLEVRPSNSAALGLYRKFGFKTIAVRKRYYQDNLEDALVFGLELEERQPFEEFFANTHVGAYHNYFSHKFDLFCLKR